MSLAERVFGKPTEPYQVLVTLGNNLDGTTQPQNEVPQQEATTPVDKTANVVFERFGNLRPGGIANEVKTIKAMQGRRK